MEYVRRAGVLLGLVLLLVVAGCTGTDGGSTAVEAGDGVGGDAAASEAAAARSQASTALAAAASDVAAAANGVETVRGQVRNASADGVETAESERTLADAERSLGEAERRLADARSAYGRGAYGDVDEFTSGARAESRAAADATARTRTALERAYTVALDRSKRALDAGYGEYQVAVAYVAAAEREGADVSEQTARLEAVRADVDAGRTAVVEERSPARADRLAASVAEESLAVQAAAVAAVERVRADTAIDDTAAVVDAAAAEEWVAAARAASAEGDVDGVRTALAAARQAQQLVDAGEYLTAVEDREGWTVEPLRERTRALRERVAAGERPAGVADHTAAVERASTCYAAIEAADAAVHDAEGYRSLLVTPDTDAAAERVAQARAALRSGDVAGACAAAADARAFAETERDALRQHTERDPLAGFYYSVRAVVVGSFGTGSAPPAPMAAFETVETATLDVSFAPPAIRTESLTFDDAPIVLPAPTAPPAAAAAEAPVGPPEFAVGIDGETSCGLTCRVVTATIENTGESTAHDVDTEFALYVQGGGLVYSGEEHVGTLRPGETRTVTKRVTVSLSEGLALRQNGARGVLDVTSDERDQSFERKMGV